MQLTTYKLRFYHRLIVIACVYLIEIYYWGGGGGGGKFFFAKIKHKNKKTKK
jgi:hypothetical protein